MTSEGRPGNLSPERAAAAERQPPSPILVCESVGKRFGQIEALKAVSFTVAAGEVFGIAGPNGAGKSTLFNVIAGAYPGTGRIIFKGRGIQGRGAHEVCRAGLARTFQIPVIFGSLPVWDNVRVGARFGRSQGRRDETAAIEDALAFVGLTGHEGEPAQHLDLLGKKRLMLAAALATDPDLLLLDEPMGGLAPNEIDLLGGLVSRLNHDRNMTVVVIEHMVRKLVQLADRLMILHHGEQIALGPPSEVVNDPQVVDLYLGTSEVTC